MKYHNKLQCHVVRITYCFETETGKLEMAEDNCCDMDGCIEIFKKIDPAVRLIETFAGSQKDTVYIFRGGEWEAA